MTFEVKLQNEKQNQLDKVENHLSLHSTTPTKSEASDSSRQKQKDKDNNKLSYWQKEKRSLVTCECKKTHKLNTFRKRKLIPQQKQASILIHEMKLKKNAVHTLTLNPQPSLLCNQQNVMLEKSQHPTWNIKLRKLRLLSSIANINVRT
ncbi:CLUMA_CG019194, isoform A [Clunio marinus]|uniref:CLUMA_CG019194, isoform A n=1 Tax=Clunio marinus TaxID=568069 RepID=A0A1J1J0X5_9DIPT|nr:CLUMA_CG019194, isoform A [Clunio marinus]